MKKKKTFNQILCHIILTKHQIWRNTSHSWMIPLASSEREPYSVHFSCNNQFCKNLAKIYTYIHLYINTLNVDIHVANSHQTPSLHHGCFMLGLEEIGPVVLKRKIFKFRNTFFIFRYDLPLEKGKLVNPSPNCKDALSYVWLKLAQWFWRRRFLNLINVCSLFPYYLPCKRAWPFIWINLNLL